MYYFNANFAPTLRQLCRFCANFAPTGLAIVPTGQPAANRCANRIINYKSIVYNLFLCPVGGWHTFLAVKKNFEKKIFSNRFYLISWVTSCYLASKDDQL